ncbi:extracellular solute-binding protein [Candidatus Bathyarchaeota archaeon]|nr:extracellular solute-binding protein [Candidatus Bathyarchaeota archaeon]
MKKVYATLLVLLMFSTMILSCPLNVMAETTNKLTIISPHASSIKNEYKIAFEAFYLATYGSSVTVEYVDTGGTSDIIAYVDAAFAANNQTTSNIDVWFGGGIEPFINAKSKNQLVPYKINQSTLDLIPQNLSGFPIYDFEYYWYGADLSGFGIIYNKAIVNQQNLLVPKTWEDLANPALQGWVGSADPRHSGSTHMVYEIMMQAYGWEKGIKLATLMGANVKSWPSSSSAVPKAVSAGDIAYALCIDYYAWAEVAKVGADKIGYILPEGLTVINPDAIGILKGAPNLELAKIFVEYVMSKEGQKLLMLPVGASGGPTKDLLGRMSIMPSLYTEIGSDSVVPLNPFTVTSQLEYNVTLGSLRYVLLNDLIGSTIIDIHSDLKLVCTQISQLNKTLIESGVSSTKIVEAVNKVGEAPINEATALTLAEDWSDTTLRNSKLSEWRTFAIKKYSDASTLATLAGLDITNYFKNVLNELETEKTNNLYMGLGGGAFVGLVIGYLLANLMGRRKEVEAIRT